MHNVDAERPDLRHQWLRWLCAPCLSHPCGTGRLPRKTTLITMANVQKREVSLRIRLRTSNCTFYLILSKSHGQLRSQEIKKYPLLLIRQCQMNARRGEEFESMFQSATKAGDKTTTKSLGNHLDQPLSFKDKKNENQDK